MNIKGLLDCLELQIDIQDLRKLGLTDVEIVGFIEFEWEPVVEVSLISLLPEEN